MAKKSDRFTSQILRADKGLNSQSRRRQAIGPLIAARGQNAGGRPVLMDAPHWSPTMIPGLHHWYDTSKMKIQVGVGMPSLEDSSGNGNHGVVQSTPAVGAIDPDNGEYCLYFDGVSQYNGPTIPAGPRAVFIAYSPDDAVNAEIYGWGRNVATDGSYAFNRGGAAGWDDGHNSWTHPTTPGLVPVVGTLWMTSTALFTRWNGKQIGGPTVSTNNISSGAQSVAIGSGFQGGTTNHLVAYLYEVFHIAADVTLTQIVTAENYLMEKWF